MNPPTPSSDPSSQRAPATVPSTGPGSAQAAAWFRVRFAVYFGLVAALFQGLVILIPQFSYAAVVPESHLIELTQAGIVALCAVGFIILAVRQPGTRDLYILLFTLSLFAILREQNNSELYQRVLHQKWMKWVLALSVLTVLSLTLRRHLFQQIRAFLMRRSISLFTAGALIVIAWAQVLSSDQIWDSRSDRLVEEALELAGYFLILCGVVEEYLAMGRER